MALIPPAKVIYPKSRIRSVKVLYDGTLSPFYEFSIAELELHDGNKVIGIRHDRNTWNENDEEKGYPTCRPGNPTWFILPEITSLTAVLTNIFGSSKEEANVISSKE